MLQNSKTMGRIDTKTMPIVTSEKLSLMIGTLPKHIAGAHAERHPREPARDVIEEERGGAHFSGAGHEREERPDDRDESRQHHGLAPVLLEELMGAFDVIGVDQPVRECRAVARPRSAGTNPPPD